MGESRTPQKRRNAIIVSIAVLLVAAATLVLVIWKTSVPAPEAPPATPAPPKPPKFEFIEKRIADLGEHRKVGGNPRTPDGTKQAFTVKRGEKFVLLVNGVETASHDRITRVTFSPNGKRLAFCATNDKESFIVLDGKEWKGSRGGSPVIRFSPDSRHVVTYADRNHRLILDNTESPQHDRVFLLWAKATVGYAVKDGTRVSVVEADWPPKDPPSDYQVVECEVGLVGDLPSVDARTNWKWREGCRNAAVHVINNGRHSVIFNGKRSPEYRSVGLVVSFSPDGNHVAFKATRKDGKNALVKDCEEVCTFVSCPGYAFSPDSARFAYAVKPGRDKEYSVVIDGGRPLHFARVNHPVFSPDSKTCAWTGTDADGKPFIMRNKKKITPRTTGLMEFVFSPDSRHLAYTALRTDGCFVGCDNMEGERFQGVFGVRFSPDSRHLLYTAKRNDKWHMVVDGVVGPPHDKAWIDVKLDPAKWPEGTFRYLAVDEGREALVEVGWPEDRDWTSGMTQQEGN